MVMALANSGMRENAAGRGEGEPALKSNRKISKKKI